MVDVRKAEVVGGINRRRALRLFAGIGAGVGTAALTAACGGGDDPDQNAGPVRVGLLAPQRGGLKGIGDEITNGFQLFLDTTDGRLGRHPVQLIKADEGDSVKTGLAALDSLYEQQVAAVVGFANAALLSAARDRIEQGKVPILAVNGTPEAMQGVSYTWCTSYAEHEPGMALGRHLAATLKDSRVAIVAPSSSSGKDAVNGFQGGFEVDDPRLLAPIWTAPRLSVAPGMFTDPVRRIVAQNASAVFCYYAGAVAVEFVRRLRESGSRAQIYGPGLLTDGTVLNELGNIAEGIVTALNYSSDLSNPINRQFNASYRQAHGFTPSQAAVAAYDAAQVLATAISGSQGPPNASAVYNGMDRVGQVESPRGVWQFNLARTPLQRWYLRSVRRDGNILANVTVSELSTFG